MGLGWEEWRQELQGSLPEGAKPRVRVSLSGWHKSRPPVPKGKDLGSAECEPKFLSLWFPPSHGPSEEMLVTGNGFNTRNIQEILVAKMSRREIDSNLGKLRREKEGENQRCKLCHGGPAPSLTFSCLVPMRR